MKKFNVYYLLSGLKSKRYLLIDAPNEDQAKIKAVKILDNKNVKYTILKAEKSLGFYI